MADESKSKPPFWTSMPGILTGVGGVIVAITGLITALYSAGVIGNKAGSTTAKAEPVAVASSPANAAPAAANDDYETLAGKWSVSECPSQYFDKVECVTWEYEATVSGNKLTLTGKVIALDEDKNIGGDAEKLKVTYSTTLNDSVGVGEYKLKRPDGSTVTNDATIRFEDDFSAFTGKFSAGDDSISLTGKKL